MKGVKETKCSKCSFTHDYGMLGNQKANSSLPLAVVLDVTGGRIQIESKKNGNELREAEKQPL